MNVLILGSGGREHTFAWKLAQSKLLKELYIAPGNAGTGELGQNIDVKADNFDAIKNICLEKKIELVVVGPEDPLVKGIHDFFLEDAALKHIPVIGPQKAGAELEGSKDFAKAFLFRHNIPTAAYQTFTPSNIENGYAFLETLKAPYVLKADGLAAGKGVLILNSIEEAKAELKEMLTEAKFGAASNKVVIEEFLDGIELSVTATVALFVAEPAGDVGASAFATTLALALGLPLVGMFALSPVVRAAFVAKVSVAEAGALGGLFALASLPVVLWWMAGWAPTRVLRGRWGGCARTKTDTAEGLWVGVVHVSVWVWATVPGPGVRVSAGLASGRFRLEFLQSSFLDV